MDLWNRSPSWCLNFSKTTFKLLTRLLQTQWLWIMLTLPERWIFNTYRIKFSLPKNSTIVWLLPTLPDISFTTEGSPPSLVLIILNSLQISEYSFSCFPVWMFIEHSVPGITYFPASEFIFKDSFLVLKPLSHEIFSDSTSLSSIIAYFFFPNTNFYHRPYNLWLCLCASVSL